MRIGILRTACAMLFCGCLGMPTISLSYGESTTNGRPPLAQEFGSKPGAYDLLVSVSQPIVDPGDSLDCKVFITGYGVIENAKVAAQHTSPGAFDLKRSTIRCSDNDPSPANPFANFLILKNGAIFDVERYRVSVEYLSPHGRAPWNFDLAIGKEARPGPYSIQFVLTYFDGQTWRTASKNADFTIRNFYQRHEGLIWWIGGVAAGLTILASAVTLWPMARQHWPISLVLVALGGMAAGGRKVISERKKRSRAK